MFALHYSFSHNDAEHHVTPATVLPLRPRNPEMDAMGRWMHGNEAFQVKNAAKAIREAMAKKAKTRG
ncbi:hypothetical protein QN397_19645 [Variovorax sp. RTB1]|uniref:hypothetical protein n=1 Tax=Variovorax sp. RTB1 TaxID=3048631 RepID=UPI002B22EB44|nr:hypothetical protein [Variovorax sp. RTB1]MEB0113525.1 hypothetical protein [Variovorax sp. RTB1]